MTIHKEGYFTLTITFVFIVIVNLLASKFLVNYSLVRDTILILSILLFLIILQFFRHPEREIVVNDKTVLSPADGKIVVIEETEEPEILKDRRIQISIFMSPVNVHVNRYPVGGKVICSKYYRGKYLVAWHPKSSTENERTSVLIETRSKANILVRQIAGALARRIVCYSQKDFMVKQGAEMGFIKFGSRVDVFLPLDSKIAVQLNQKVIGGVTVLAELV